MSAVKGTPVNRTKTVGLRRRAWWVFRKYKTMTIAQIQDAICNGNEGNPKVNLRTWLNYLVMAGLVERERIDDGILTSNGSYLYRLVNDIGYKPPVVQVRHRRVFDPNSGKTFPLPPAITRRRDE